MKAADTKTEYPFIKHIPIADAMSGSHVSGRAMTLLGELETGLSNTLSACKPVPQATSDKLPAINIGQLPVRR